MANAGGSSLAKSGSSASLADKFAEARATTRAPGFGAAAAATLARNAPPGPIVHQKIGDGSPKQNAFAESVRSQYVAGLKSQANLLPKAGPTYSAESRARDVAALRRSESYAAKTTSHRFWINHAGNVRSNFGRVMGDLAARHGG